MVNMERIDIYVDDIDEIFNQFDHNDINDCLAEYIENRCSRIRKNELEINIYTNEKLNSDIKDRIVDVIRRHFGLEIKYNLIEANRRSSPNAAFGIFLVVFLLYFLVCWPISRLAAHLEKCWA